jgi:hypothetical protein
MVELFGGAGKNIQVTKSYGIKRARTNGFSNFVF